MNKILMRVLSVVLIVSLFLTSNLTVFAAAEEVYLSDLRLVYAESYDEAKEILSGTEFKDYKILNENLNEGTKKIGVWLAYKTTTDIEDAITDLAVMQMDGGYKEGNYQEMIQESYSDYLKMGQKYLTAITYFNEAYDADHFLARLAYRQLNFYTVKTVGIDKKYAPKFEGDLLGDAFYNGVDGAELATLFMEGNVHVLNNIRSLLSMGTSYNEDGKTYLEKVGEAAADLAADPEVDQNDSEKDYDALATMIAPTVIALKEMFQELSAYEAELNFEDQEVTDEELKYAEHKALANMTRAVPYLNGKTLYDFCLGYTLDKSDYSSLYPLVAALNEGQQAMTELACYYEVIRYSMSDYPEEYLEAELEKQEEIYGENPFNVYEGVDRTVFKGTFALTTDAYRADAYTEQNTLADAYFGGWKNTLVSVTGITAGACGIGFMIWGAFERKAENAAALAAKNEIMKTAADTYSSRLADAMNTAATTKLAAGSSVFEGNTLNGLMDDLMKHYFANDPTVNLGAMSFSDKFYHFQNAVRKETIVLEKISLDDIQAQNFSTHSDMAWEKVQNDIHAVTQNFDAKNSLDVANQVREATTTTQMATSTILYLYGGVMLLYTAISLGSTVINYYFPDYSDIPLSMVDMRETAYGDRYIKYDVVYEAEMREKGYAAGDLNAFKAQRWNALYYTKSYEAGKPLLADAFTVSGSNNKAKENYTPVHRFGEVVCYDLNKYNFKYDTGIYLSVKQSKYDKSAAADVPKVVGSILADGLWLLFGGIGVLIGVCGTMGTQSLLKKKNGKDADEKS